MENKRKSDRRKVFYYLKVEDAQDGSLLGRLGDISRDGLMLLSSAALPLNRRYGVEVALPSSPDFDSGSIQLEIETLWTRPDANPQVFCTGCALVEPLAGLENVLDRLVEYYAFSDGYKVLRQPWRPD